MLAQLYNGRNRMKIAAISDIHGNLYALDAVLADIERRGVDLTSRVRAAELDTRFPGLLASILKSYRKEASRPAR